MRVCSVCKLDKPIEEFSKKRVKKNGEQVYQNSCKSCHKIYSDTHYIKNKLKYIKKAKVRAKIYRTEMYTFLIEYFASHPCVDCGQSNPLVLEFDHVKGEKVAAVSEMVAKQYSKEIILNEIEKCEVRCANCHRIKTAERGNWEMYRLIASIV